MKWQTHSGDLTNIQKVKVYSTLPEFSATKIVMWGFHVDDSAISRYDMILDRDILTALRLYSKLSDHVIKGGDETFERCTAPMVNMGTYKLGNLDIGKITPKEYFTNSYVEEVFESEKVPTSTKVFRIALDAKYTKTD